MIDVYVNFEKIDFSAGMGVNSVALNLLPFLCKSPKLNLIGVLKNKNKIVPKHFIDCVDDVVTVERTFRNDESFEILLHHFQEPITKNRFILLLHDFHLFDCPWKYDNFEQLKQLFTMNCRSSEIIITHFPRTFFQIDKYVGGIGPKIFLTHSPLMKTPKNDDDEIISENILIKHGIKNEKILLYPAQLQKHKNHINLIKAFEIMSKKNNNLKLILTGSDFDNNFSHLIKSMVLELGFKDKIILPGFLNNIEYEALFTRSDLIVVPSLAEGGGYIALEAIESKKPFAVSNIESAKMHLSMYGRFDQHFFDPYNISEMAEVCLRQLKSREIYPDSIKIIRSQTWKLNAEYICELIEHRRKRMEGSVENFPPFCQKGLEHSLSPLLRHKVWS